MTKISILYIINGLSQAGTEKQLIKLLNKLNPNDFNLFLACFNESNEFINRDKIQFYQFLYKPMYRPKFWFEVFKLAIYVYKNNIEIIQTYFQDPTIIGAFLRLLVKTKLIINFRDLGFWENRLEKIKMNFFFRFGDVFVSNAHAVKMHYIKNYRIPEKKSVVIHNGLDLKGMVGNRNVNVKILGIVANFNRRVKRVDDFIKMASFVIQKYNNVKFIIIGDGYLRHELEALANELHILNKIDFVGRSSNPEKYISKFYIGVLTSQSEGLSNAIMEYMAFGLPVVCTNVGGNPELIEDETNGFLVDSGRPDLLAEKVLYLLNNPDVAARIGRINKEKISKFFTTSAMINKYKQMYFNLVRNV